MKDLYGALGAFIAIGFGLLIFVLMIYIQIRVIAAAITKGLDDSFVGRWAAKQLQVDEERIVKPTRIQ